MTMERAKITEQGVTFVAVRLPQGTVGNEREGGVLREILEEAWGTPVALIWNTPERSDASAVTNYQVNSAIIGPFFSTRLGCIKWEIIDFDPFAEDLG